MSDPAPGAPVLLLINGLPGSGKSTLARRFTAERPLALGLDIDVVRGLLGAWAAQPGEAGVLARRLALAMAGVALDGGHDVVVPQFLGRVEFIVELDDLAHCRGVRFVETLLVEDLDTTLSRLEQRAHDPADATHRDARVLLEDAGGASHVLPQMQDRLEQVQAARPATRRVAVVRDDVEETFRRLVAML